ncbi:MAG: BlaI/MecI/CopY family transcriptional regulator [Candidatus Kaiserbacteria bacterium]|nr:BlaI/MecI/CopY family transcriptional regulator [Candidatus Kaiserbacteria bacterium]
MFEKFLEEIGLSEKEAKIYLALLQVDSDSIHDIATKTKINRTTVYPVLESLGKKGLVSETQDGKKTLYQAAAPERLETYMERQKVVLQEQSARLKDIIPQIKSIQREQGERPIIKYFDGRDGAISAYEEFYSFDPKKNETGYFIYNRDLVSETFTEEERKKFLTIRYTKTVIPNSIYTNKDGKMEFTTPGIRTRIDSGEKYPILADITIIEDRIIAVTLGNVISSVLIKSKDLAVTLSSLVRYINDTSKNEKGGK